ARPRRAAPGSTRRRRSRPPAPPAPRGSSPASAHPHSPTLSLSPHAAMTTQSPRTAVGRRLAALALVALVGAATASEALAQRVTPPGGRRTVAYVSPDELVSFPAATPFDD